MKSVVDGDDLRIRVCWVFYSYDILISEVSEQVIALRREE